MVPSPWAGAGLHLPQPKMLEDLFNHFPIFDESDDPHLTLAFGIGQGINLNSLFTSNHKIRCLAVIMYQLSGHPGSFILSMYKPSLEQSI